MAFKVLCVDHVGVAVKDLQLIKQQMLLEDMHRKLLIWI